METTEDYKEKVIRHYLVPAVANNAIDILTLLDKYGSNEHEEELDHYVYMGDDVIEDSERAFQLSNIVRKHGILLLKELGLLLNDDHVAELSLSNVNHILTALTSVNSLDTADSLFILSLKTDEVSDIDAIIQILAIQDTLDTNLLGSVIDDVSESLLDNIFSLVNDNINESTIEPLDLNRDELIMKTNMLDKLRDTLPVPTPDEVVKTILDLTYKEGLNATYLNDLIKPIKYQVERYIDIDEVDVDKTMTYLTTLSSSILFVNKVLDEDEPLLTTLDVLQDYLPSVQDIKTLNAKVTSMDNAYLTSGLYDYIQGVQHAEQPTTITIS